jgi:hypothetical protein
MFSWNAYLVIAIKSKNTEFAWSPNKEKSKNVVYFSNIHYYTKFKDPTLCGGGSVAPNL